DGRSVVAELGRPHRLVASLCHEDALAADDRRGIAGILERRFPADVLLRAPGAREVFLGAVALAVRAAPGGPVVGQGGSSAQTADKNSDDVSLHGKIPVPKWRATLVRLSGFQAGRTSFLDGLSSVQGTGLPQAESMSRNPSS